MNSNSITFYTRHDIVKEPFLYLLSTNAKTSGRCEVHYFVTVWIGVSYAYGWNRVGAVVMVLLDPADVPLHIAKQFKYIGDARGGNTQKLMQAGADFFFVVFMLLFGIIAPWSLSLRGMECSH